VEVTSSSFRICWDGPEYHGSPYLAGYDISYNGKFIRTEAECFDFDSDHLEWGQIYNITVSAVSETKIGNPSESITPIMGKL
jgi:hypothetical protein